jgi:hypothetical protein
MTTYGGHTIPNIFTNGVAPQEVFVFSIASEYHQYDGLAVSQFNLEQSGFAVGDMLVVAHQSESGTSNPVNTTKWTKRSSMSGRDALHTRIADGTADDHYQVPAVGAGLNGYRQIQMITLKTSDPLKSVAYDSRNSPDSAWDPKWPMNAMSSAAMPTLVISIYARFKQASGGLVTPILVNEAFGTPINADSGDGRTVGISFFWWHGWGHRYDESSPAIPFTHYTYLTRQEDSNGQGNQLFRFKAV